MRNIRESKEEEDFTTIQENSPTSTATTSMASSNSISSSWSRFKDPRIVRVSRASGGKDRHSKVSTVRGLRDRRVRLSVPTAIQLYDLQERLGLNQPSKVVDWLLNVAKHEIDELPPLQYPVGRSNQNLHQDPAFLEFGVSQSDKQGLKISGSTVDWPRNEEERQFSFGNQGGGPFVVSGANNNLDSQSPYNNQVFRWDPSNLTLSHQILVYQSGTRPHESHFPSSLDPKQLNFQASRELSVSPITSTVDGSNTCQSLRPSSHFSVTENLLPSENSTQHS